MISSAYIYRYMGPTILMPVLNSLLEEVLVAYILSVVCHCLPRGNLLF